MKIITTLIIALSLALPVFCQTAAPRLSPDLARQVYQNAELADKNRTGTGSLAKTDDAYKDSVRKLRLEFFAAAKDRPAELQALTSDYLEAHKKLLRGKELYLYTFNENFVPVGLKVERQRHMTKITSADGTINALLRNEVLDKVLTSLARSYYDAPKKEEFKHGGHHYREEIKMDKFNFLIESSSTRVSIDLNYDTTPPAPALGRKSDAPKPTSKRYILTDENVRALYLQFAEADPRTKSAPAFLD